MHLTQRNATGSQKKSTQVPLKNLLVEKPHGLVIYKDVFYKKHFSHFLPILWIKKIKLNSQKSKDSSRAFSSSNKTAKQQRSKTVYFTILFFKNNKSFQKFTQKKYSKTYLLKNF